MSAGSRQNSISVPVHITEISIFDNAFALMKQKFTDEMRKMEEEMDKISKELISLYGQNSTVQAGPVTKNKTAKPFPVTDLDSLASSPLVQGEGQDKTLKLQFNVSQFDPSEVNVQILGGLLIVSAIHEEKTDNSLDFREYNREFVLPEGIDPEAIVSDLSRDGVLTVDIPFPKPKAIAIEETDSAPRFAAI